MKCDQQIGRLLRRRGPLLGWVAALFAVVWLARGLPGAGTAPAVAERREVSVTALRASRVEAIAVRSGEAVRAGQVVARLDTTFIDAELSVARAELARLRLEGEAARTTLSEQAQSDRDELAGEVGRSALDVAQLEAEAQRDRSELAQLDELIVLQRQLVAEQLASTEQLNKHKLLRAKLAKTVEEYAHTLELARGNTRTAKRRLARVEQRGNADSDALQAQLAPYQAAVVAQAERVSWLEQVRDSLQLRAPFSGRVGNVVLRAGDAARVGDSVLTVVHDRPDQVVAFVDEMAADRVRPGDLVALRYSDGSSGRRQGRVVGLGASITELPERFKPVPGQPAFCREVYVELEQSSDRAPLPGQAFDASFTRRERSQGLALLSFLKD